MFQGCCVLCRFQIVVYFLTKMFQGCCLLCRFQIVVYFFNKNVSRLWFTVVSNNYYWSIDIYRTKMILIIRASV